MTPQVDLRVHDSGKNVLSRQVDLPLRGRQERVFTHRSNGSSGNRNAPFQNTVGRDDQPVFKNDVGFGFCHNYSRMCK